MGDILAGIWDKSNTMAFSVIQVIKALADSGDNHLNFGRSRPGAEWGGYLYFMFCISGLNDGQVACILDTLLSDKHLRRAIECL